MCKVDRPWQSVFSLNLSPRTAARKHVNNHDDDYKRIFANKCAKLNLKDSLKSLLQVTITKSPHGRDRWLFFIRSSWWTAWLQNSTLGGTGFGSLSLFLKEANVLHKQRWLKALWRFGWCGLLWRSLASLSECNSAEQEQNLSFLFSALHSQTTCLVIDTGSKRVVKPVMITKVLFLRVILCRQHQLPLA